MKLVQKFEKFIGSKWSRCHDNAQTEVTWLPRLPFCRRIKKSCEQDSSVHPLQWCRFASSPDIIYAGDRSDEFPVIKPETATNHRADGAFRNFQVSLLCHSKDSVPSPWPSRQTQGLGQNTSNHRSTHFRSVITSVTVKLRTKCTNDSHPYHQAAKDPS